MPTAADVIAGKAKWSAEKSDALDWLRSLPDDSVDLLFTSPPYELARTYGIGDKMVGGQKWVNWMVAVVTAASPKVKGLIAVNCEGQTRGYRYSCVPFLLMADLHRAGFCLRKPPVFHRVGIPGSGGPDWLRNDYEPIVCVTRKGKLPWSDNTACGHPPKWAPGGEMAHRLNDGKRINQRGPVGSRNGGGKRFKHGEETEGDERPRPSHVKVSNRQIARENGMKFGSATSGVDDFGTANPGLYLAPAIANPGNVIGCTVGGGAMGHAAAHDNEAPFPLELAAFFVKSFCPPDGVTADCFDGSGTTIDAAVQHGRRGIGCDIRESQVQLVERRMRTVTAALFAS